MSTITDNTEEMILGAVLQSENVLLQVMDTIDIEDFSSQANRIIFNAIIDVYRDGGGIDIGLIYSRIREVSTQISATYISSLINNGSMSSNIKTYINNLKNKALHNRVVVLAKSIINQSKDVQDGQDILFLASAGLLDIANRTREQSSPDIESIYAEVVEGWHRIDRGERVCVPVDQTVTSSGILGWYPGHLILIGGYTSTGKSFYLNQIVTDACREGASILIFSLEDKRTDKLIKILSNITDIHQSRLVSGGFDCRHTEIIQNGWNSMRDYKLLIYDDIYSIEEMRLKIRKAKLMGPLDMVCVDFVQNIIGDGGIYERMSHAAITLQKMAKEFNVTMIALSQVSNESMRGDSEIIGLKGAGELASASDIVLWLKRVKGVGNERKLELEIKKNRPFGETGVRHLKFSERWTRIERG